MSTSRLQPRTTASPRGTSRPRRSATAGSNRAIPATSAETERQATGELTTPAERATLHGHLGPGQGRNDRGPASPGITGGDRRRDYERTADDSD